MKLLQQPACNAFLFVQTNINRPYLMRRLLFSHSEQASEPRHRKSPSQSIQRKPDLTLEVQDSMSRNAGFDLISTTGKERLFIKRRKNARLFHAMLVVKAPVSSLAKKREQELERKSMGFNGEAKAEASWVSWRA